MTKRMRNSETPPGLLLLTLLAQCCQVCLKENAVNSLAEVREGCRRKGEDTDRKKGCLDKRENDDREEKEIE